MIKYYTKMVCFQEVPDEISLSFNVAGCPLNCKNCSWQEYKNSKTTDLTDSLYIGLLKKYKDLVSCILFLGGEWEKEDLCRKLKLAKEYGYKTCLYTGLEFNELSKEILSELNYVKTGRYIEKLGGLTSKNTNQKFIELKTGKLLNYKFIKENL